MCMLVHNWSLGKSGAQDFRETRARLDRRSPITNALDMCASGLVRVPLVDAVSFVMNNGFVYHHGQTKVRDLWILAAAAHRGF